jgi:hypothetical protein
MYLSREEYFIEYLVTHRGTDLIPEFFLVGVFLAGFWIGCGLLCVWLYKSYLELKRKGYRKKKGWLNGLMKVKEKK